MKLIRWRSFILWILSTVSAIAHPVKCYCTDDHCVPYGVCESNVCLVGIIRSTNSVIRTCGSELIGCKNNIGRQLDLFIFLITYYFESSFSIQKKIYFYKSIYEIIYKKQLQKFFFKYINSIRIKIFGFSSFFHSFLTKIYEKFSNLKFFSFFIEQISILLLYLYVKGRFICPLILNGSSK